MERAATRERNGASGGGPGECDAGSEATRRAIPRKKNGAEDWNRTSDTSIFSAVLYRLSYLGTALSLMAELKS